MTDTPRGRGTIAGVIFALAIGLGANEVRLSRAPVKVVANGARLYDEVRQAVATKYVDSLSDSVLYRRSVDGLLQELGDPHSAYLPPERFKRLSERTAGNYGGVGAQVDLRDGWVTVIAPMPGTPAEEAGISTGDRIVEIGGQSTRGWSVEEAVRAIRGEPSTPVHIAVQSPLREGRRDLTLVRREIHMRAVPRATMLRSTVGYVDLNEFSDSASTELGRAIDSLSKAGMTSLVFDLRGNPGGLLEQGLAVTEMFLPAGAKVVSLRGRTKAIDRDLVAGAGRKWTNLPVVVLVNRGSASASEIVAGALQDHDRAVILGTTTFGKGSAQSVFGLGEGALKLTTAKWYTPLGRSISRATRPKSSDDDTAVPDSARTHIPFRTAAGRTVYGGDAITPDVVVADTARTPAELALEGVVKGRVSAFRDALGAAALVLKGRVTNADFVVDDSMRARLRTELGSRKLPIDDDTWRVAQPVIDRLLGVEIARAALGAAGVFQRQVRNDPMLQRALDLADGATSTSVLFSRAAAKTG
jgi:carboxyl-terminal processing protease